MSVPCSGIIFTPEGLEHLRQVLKVERRCRISNCPFDFCGRNFTMDMHGSSFRPMAHGIIEKIAQHRAKQYRIAFHRKVFIKIDRNGEVPGIRGFREISG